MVVLKTKKLEKEFPLFTRIYEIAYEGKAPSTIVQL
jgi:glycerol-3-phosphate dehydrogenase